jgi:hypothetical protein
MLNHQQLDPNQSNYDYVLDLVDFQLQQLVEQLHSLVLLHHPHPHHRHLHHWQHQ